MPHHIGIVACSAEGAALCYRTICADGARLIGSPMGAHGHPEVSMHTPPFARYVQCLDRNDWEGVGELMLASASKLAGAGAEFLICPDNTIHQALPHVEPRSPLPWLHIADAVTDAAVARGFRRLGLTGTRWLVEGPVYPDKLAAKGIGYEIPTDGEREEINRIIMQELVCGVFRPEAVACFRRVIGRMRAAGCDAVVLGCTEIPLTTQTRPCRRLDSTRLLALAALRRALQRAVSRASFAFVIPALVAGMQLVSCFRARGRLDAGDTGLRRCGQATASPDIACRVTISVR